MTQSPLLTQEADHQLVVLRRSRSYYVGVLRGFVIFLVIIWTLIIYQQWLCIGIGLLLYTIFGIKNCISNINDDSIQIEINAVGIIRKGYPLLPWAQIYDVWLQNNKGTFVIFELENGSRIQLQLSGLDMLPSEFEKHVRAHLAVSSPSYIVYKEGFINRLLKKRMTPPNPQ